MSTAPKVNLTNPELKTALSNIRNKFEIAIYSSENYFNAGSILRTGHCFLCSRVWLIDFNKFYKKATMGTSKFETIEKTSLDQFISINKERNIVAFEHKFDVKSDDIRDFKYPNNPILFFGSEKTGVPSEIMDIAHSNVSIPMFGYHNDLNVAVAAGIVMYDFINKNGSNSLWDTISLENHEENNA